MRRNFFILNKVFLYFFSIFFFIVSFPLAIIARFACLCNRSQKKLVWGSTPIINNSYWSNSMVEKGYFSETFTTDYYTTINKRSDWDKLLREEYFFAFNFIKPYIAFLHSLFVYDVFFISFDGFFIGSTPAWFLQAQLFKLSGKKIVVIPYGSDAYIYNRIRSLGTIHGLLSSYPSAAKKQRQIAKKVDYWCAHAHAVIPCFMGPDGFGRWDVLLPNSLMIDLKKWKSSIKNDLGDGIHGKVVIVHAPNHRGFKGTEFIIEAVTNLQEEGLNVELKLLEQISNTEVQKVLETSADILVDQLVCSGHGLNAIEGMCSGIPTISNLDDEFYITVLRRWSYFNECPLVSSSPETITEVLRKLVTRPELRRELGMAGRAYVEKYHGLDSAQYLFSNVIDYVYGRKESLINLYHPILGDYPNRSPKIKHPLVNNRIVD